MVYRSRRARDNGHVKGVAARAQEIPEFIYFICKWTKSIQRKKKNWNCLGKRFYFFGGGEFLEERRVKLWISYIDLMLYIAEFNFEIDNYWFYWTRKKEKTLNFNEFGISKIIRD